MDHRPGTNDFVLEMGGSRPEDVQHHFDTPTWLRPRAEARELAERPVAIPEQANGEPEPVQATAEAAAVATKAAPAIPRQAVPSHDRSVRADERPAIPAEAKWKSRHKVRTFFGLLLVPFLGAAVAGGYYAYTQGSLEYLPVAAIPALVIVGIWGAMINTTPTVTTLKDSRIAVRHDGVTDEFDLANPDQAIETARDASDPRWKVTFERVDGSQLALTRRHVPPAEFMTILQHYRRIAAELMEQRIRRYQA
jgi:hypothetical protein